MSASQGTNSYLEANTYFINGKPATVTIASNLVVTDPTEHTNFVIPFVNTTTYYTDVGPALNARDDSSSCSANEKGYVYILRNPSSGEVGSVRSTASNGPSLSGALIAFRQWAGPVFAYQADNSCNPFNIEGYGKTFWYTNNNASPIPFLAQGRAGLVKLDSMRPTDWAIIPVSPYVPDLARDVYVSYGCDGSQGSVAHLLIAPANTWTGPQPGLGVASPTIPLALTAGPGVADFRQAKIALRDESGRNIYWANDNPACSIQLEGWSF